MEWCVYLCISFAEVSARKNCKSLSDYHSGSISKDEPKVMDAVSVEVFEM